MDEAQTAFWDGLEERVAACRALESKICASLMKGQDFDDETSVVLEDLVFFVTTEFPVSDSPNYREEDAAQLIELAQEVSEKFTAFYEMTNIMSAGDFDEVSRLRQSLKQTLERIVAASAAARSNAMQSLSPPVASLPVAIAPTAITKKLPQIPAMRKTVNASTQLSRSSGGADDNEFVSPVQSPKSGGGGRLSAFMGVKSQSVASGISTSGGNTPGSPALVQRGSTPRSPPQARGHMSMANLSLASGSQAQTQEVDISCIAARFYHTSGYDRPNQRILFHGGLRRDKPSRMCLSQLYALDVSGSVDSKLVWQSIETTMSQGAAVPALCWHSNVFLDHTHWMIFGGKSASNQTSNAAYVLDLTTMVWSAVPPAGAVPEARSGHCMHRMPDGDTFVVFGGMDATGSKCLNDVFVFDRISRKWKQQPTTNPPVARFVHASAVLGKHLWILGGLKGSLSKSSPCGDLWCLNLETWEWTQPKPLGASPEPGTYALFPLDGESGSELLCLGSKAMDDTRATYYILSVVGDPRVPGGVVWIRGQFPPKLKPTVSEGMSCCVVQKNVFLLGGRPGDAERDCIDVCVIPRDLFVQQVAAEKKLIAPQPLQQQTKKGKRLSQSSGMSASQTNIIKKNVGAAATVGGRSGKKMEEELRQMALHQSDNDLLNAHREAAGRGDPALVVSRETVSAALVSPRGKEGELREMLNNLQHNFELELSLRLDVESKFQSLARDYAALREAYGQLQNETSRLFQLAMTEVTTGQGREKLERRYDELRSASSEFAVAEPPKLGGRANAVMVKEKSSFFATQSGKSGAKKDKMLEFHLQCVEKLNGDVNKLLRPVTMSLTAPPFLSAITAPVVAAAAAAAAAATPTASTSSQAVSSSPQTVARVATAKLLPVPPSAVPSSGSDGRRSGSGSPTALASPRDMENADTDDLPFSPMEPPDHVSEVWRSPDLATEFTLFVEHEFPQQVSNAVFCRAVHHLLSVGKSKRAALIECLVSDFLVPEADMPVAGLAPDVRETMVDDSNGRWVTDPPDDAYWQSLLTVVEAELKPAYAQYAAALESPASRRQHHLSQKRRGDGGGHHQLVATAEEQLRERLAEMGKDSDQASAASESGEATDEFLFKKVTSELISTEINYVTDLKVTTTMFRRPLTEEKSAILPLEVFNIFANIEDVYALNRKFLTVLQKEHGKPLGSKNYGKVFLEFASQFQKVYLTYAGRKTVSRNTLDRLSATNKKFVAFLEDCLQKPPCRRLELKSFLIKPVQRICKYPLLLRTMVDSAPKGYPDKASLVEAKKKMEEVVLALEDQLFVEDDKMKVLELEGALNWHREPKLSLAVEGRSMLYDSVLIVSEMQVGASADEAMMKNMRNIHFYLLNDVALMVEQVEKKGVRRDFLYRVIAVAYSVVVPVPGKAAFQVLQPQQDFKYLFRCASMEQKMTWVRVLTDAISAARNKDGAPTLPSAVTGSATSQTTATTATTATTSTTPGTGSVIETIDNE